MNAALLESILKMLVPIAMQEWEAVGKPMVQALIAKTGADEQVLLNALLAALDSVAVVEAPKI